MARDDRSLLKAFLAHAPKAVARRVTDPAALGKALRAALSSARSAYPEVTLDDEAFAAHLAERMAEADEPLVAVQALHAGDLLLACACLRGDSLAQEQFDRRFRPVVAEAVGRMVAGESDFVEEVRQALREKLLVGARGGRPKLLDYAGKGPLGSWIRSAAVRTALNLKESGRRESPMEDALAAQLPEAADDPELRLLKSRCKKELKGAFQAALKELTDQERSVLRLNLVEGRSIDQIAERFRTHRSTAARWLTQAKERVMELTRQELRERLKWSDRDLRSVVALVRSQLELSIHRYL